jgi:hypothetical protein
VSENDATDVDMAKASLDPVAVFHAPEEVRDHPRLTAEQKIDLLRRWRYDATQLQLAEQEGMAGTDDDTLRRVVLALEALTNGTGNQGSGR